ncbi:AraC family transcriptional regulator, partial [Gordonia sp. 852002-10350_SCH5691597]|uniref:AraC family transcriptional regulator n=1 Tax=Gordonia sp. 852002-10350_SCH5691597 TaxID=1834085 RepID=UPI000A42DD03
PATVRTRSQQRPEPTNRASSKPGAIHFATFQIRGSCLIEQADHTHLAAPGSLFIYDSSLPFRMHADGPYEQVVVQVGADRAFALAGMDRTTDILATPMECSGVLSAVSAFFTQLAHYQTDYTLMDYLRRARVEAAQNLLRNHPTKSISHISREAGFNDERSFYRTFRTITGMTPNDYREQFH